MPAARLDLLRTALGPHADQVRFVDMSRAGRNPGRIIPGVLRAFCDAHPTGRVRIIGEPVWPGRTPLEYPACVQHEALINAAFHGRDVTILCPYDAGGLDADVLSDAYATHPVVIEGGRRRTSTRYAPESVVATYNVPLPEPGRAARFAFDDERLRGARQFAVEAAAELGVTGSHDDLAIAVAELTTNSVLHGGGSGVIRVWSEDGQVVCEVRDAGRLSDPLMRPPGAAARTARRTRPADGPSARRPRPHPRRPHGHGHPLLPHPPLARCRAGSRGGPPGPRSGPGAPPPYRRRTGRPGPARSAPARAREKDRIQPSSPAATKPPQGPLHPTNVRPFYVPVAPSAAATPFGFNS